MEKIIQVLFNTNHEPANIWVVLLLIGVAFVLPSIAQYYGQRRSGRPGSQTKQKRKK